MQALEAQIADPHLWDNPEQGAALLAKRTRLIQQRDFITDLQRRYQDAKEMIELAESENDATCLQSAENDFMALESVFQKAELESLLCQEADGNDAFVEIHAGAGGTEAQDWAQMLERMYMMWGEKRAFEVAVCEETPGEEAGMKALTLQIKGANAYGWLKSESGVHRLVRISPFDANARRHTSFASVWVYPVVDDSIHIDINPADCRIDTYRSSGAGGQHVNKTDSAIRITHIPTGIVVQCQNQRSQIQNKEEAWKMLRSRLYERELAQRQAQQSQTLQAKGDNGWGNQIRSYVLQPYQMVKDLRTDYETSDTSGVLDGDIDGFMRAFLAMKKETT